MASREAVKVTTWFVFNEEMSGKRVILERDHINVLYVHIHNIKLWIHCLHISISRGCFLAEVFFVLGILIFFCLYCIIKRQFYFFFCRKGEPETPNHVILMTILNPAYPITVVSIIISGFYYIFYWPDIFICIKQKEIPLSKLWTWWDLGFGD